MSTAQRPANPAQRPARPAQRPAEPEQPTAEPEERPAEPTAGDFGWSLGLLLRSYQHTATAAIGDLPGGPRGYHTLATVVHGDQPSQLALAAHLGIDRTVMTYLIDDLVAAGLVERQLNPADRRQRKIVATPLGAHTLGVLERRVQEAEDGLLGTLDATERDTFRGLLRRVACDMRDSAPGMDACAVTIEALAG